MGIDVSTLDEIARRYGGGGHSIFAPSASAMWLNCPGSLIPNLLAPDNAGEDAAVGTVFHEVMETWNRTNERPDYLVGEQRTAEAGGTKYIITIDDEMLEYAADCRRWIAPLVPHIIGVEWKVDFSALTPLPRQRGTADLVARKEHTLYIRDWKYGKGVRVYAEQNTQLMLYAYGAYSALSEREQDWIDRINVGIAQPRLGVFEDWTIGIEALLTWANGVAKPAARAAWRLDAPRKPSPKACQWCKVRGSCSALAQQTTVLVDASFEDLSDEPRDPKTMTTAALAKVKRWRKTVEAWFADAEAELQRRVEAGETGHGFKMAQGRSRRAWKNERVTETVLKRLGLPEGKIIIRELLSPNQAEAVLKAHGIGGAEQKNLLAVLVHRPPGKPTLVEDSDPRPALPAPADGAFDDIDNMEDTDL
jgi:hypothetical protein